MEGMAERRTLYIPKTIDEKVEETRRSLGMSRSRFYLYAVTKLLQELSVLSSTVHSHANSSIHKEKNEGAKDG